MIFIQHHREQFRCIHGKGLSLSLLCVNVACNSRQFLVLLEQDLRGKLSEHRYLRWRTSLWQRKLLRRCARCYSCRRCRGRRCRQRLLFGEFLIKTLRTGSMLGLANFLYSFAASACHWILSCVKTSTDAVVPTSSLHSSDGCVAQAFFCGLPAPPRPGTSVVQDCRFFALKCACPSISRSGMSCTWPHYDVMMSQTLAWSLLCSIATLFVPALLLHILQFQSILTPGWYGSKLQAYTVLVALHTLDCIVQCTKQRPQFLLCCLWLYVVLVDISIFALLGPTGKQQCRCLASRLMCQLRFVNILRSRGYSSNYFSWMSFLPQSMTVTLDSAMTKGERLNYRARRLMCRMVCPGGLVIYPQPPTPSSLIRGASRPLPRGHRSQSISRSPLRLLIFVLLALGLWAGHNLRDSFVLHEYPAAPLAPKVLLAHLAWCIYGEEVAVF